MPYYVYTHTRPDNGQVFYVGCATSYLTKGPSRRYRRAYDFGLRTDGWFSVFEGCGKRVLVAVIFETENRGEAFAKEREMIGTYGRKDLQQGSLVNETDGGAGACGQINSLETRLKKASTKYGRDNPMYGRTGRNHPLARLVVNNATGEVFESVTAAALFVGCRMQTLHNMLTGFRKNTTTLRFV